MSKTNPSRLAAEELIARILQDGKLYFDGEYPYLRQDLFYERVSDEAAKRYIVGLLNEAEKISTPNSEYGEALDRLRLLDSLQLHLSDNLKNQQYLVNCQNGIFDAKNGILIQDRGKGKFCYCCNFQYRPRSNLDQVPNFKRYLMTSVGEANVSCFLACLGFLLSDILEAKKAVFFVGDGNTGKSMICDFMTDLIGKHAVCNEPFEKIGNEFSRHNFIGRKINVSRETNRAVLKNESAFKSVVACENISGRRRYHDGVDFVSQLKLLIASNQPPEFSRMDEAILDRIVIIFFHSTLEEKDLDRDLRSKLYQERDAIGSLCLDALHELVKSGYDFHMSPESKAYLNACRIQLHSVEEFLADRCEMAKDAAVSSAALWDAYQKYCMENGVDALGRNTFFQQVSWLLPGVVRDRADIGGRRLHAFIGMRFKRWTHPSSSGTDQKNEQLGPTESV